MEETTQLNNEDLNALAEFFDLLARFDFEDKKASGLKAGPLKSAPKGSASSPGTHG